MPTYEPLKATAAWQSYTPARAELLQHRNPGAYLHIIQDARSVAADDAQIGKAEDNQGTVLGPMDSVTVIADVEVHYRSWQPVNQPAAPTFGVGRLPQ